MIDTTSLISTHKRVLSNYGTLAQVEKLKEELLELITEVDYFLEHEQVTINLVYEISDVINVLSQAIIAFGFKDRVKEITKEKMDRTVKRMEAEK